MDELSNKIKNQNIQVQNLIDNEKKNLDNISLEIDKEMANLVNKIKELKNLNALKMKNPLINGVSFKISEFNSKIAKNEEIIKKNKDEIPDILRKKKESEEFFNKFMGEKKVWLDRLQEKKFQEIAYSKGFKYLYEAKTIKLLMEGILLHKVQDEIEKELTVKGNFLGWDIMNVEQKEEQRKKEEFEMNLELVNIQNNEEAINKEREFKEKCDREDKETKKRRQEIQQQWKDLWGEIWVPSIAYNGDDDWTTKKKLVQDVMMEVTFKLFKKLMFDVWKFKNILNNTDEYVILEKIKKYLNEAENDFYIMGNKPNNQRKDEDAFDKMTNIIENIRREEELIYCDLKPAKKKWNDISISSGGVSNASADRILSLINKIESFQNNTKQNPNALNKREVEEIYGMIKSLPDENEKKLFRDNLLDDSRLYDVFLPLTTLLMIMTFLSIGVKRTKNYEKKLEEIEEENEKLELENEEIKGKLNTLKELNSKIEEGGNEDNNLIDFNESSDSLIDITTKVKDTKNNINNQQNQLFNDIQSYLVRP